MKCYKTGCDESYITSLYKQQKSTDLYALNDSLYMWTTPQ
jgi:hypothetical protein